MNPLTLLDPVSAGPDQDAAASDVAGTAASEEAGTAASDVAGTAASEEAGTAAPGTPSVRATPRLELPPYDLAAALELERRLGVSHALAQVLVRRDLADPGAARAFLDAEDAQPHARFPGIEDAVALITKHVDAGSRIVVHGDYDVDGVCATALLTRVLRALGGDVHPFLPSRTEDGYGLAMATVERLAARRTGLLVTVDCGITAVEEVAAARSAGIDVVITDHHQPARDGRLPDAPLVHPGICGYRSPDLCGTGVAYKLAQALGAPNLEDELELVALATVADLMPLRRENRHLVRTGLEALSRTSRIGLRALMAVAGVDPSEVDASTLGFRLAPRINAAGRLARADAGLELLLTDDAERAREIAAELDALNTERRDVEQRILWEADAQVQDLGERFAYVLAARDWHPGVIGIVASRIVERYHRPTLLIALDEHGEGHGSGRSIPGFDLLGGLHDVADLLGRYGGHTMAAGLSVNEDQIAELRERFERHAAELLTPDLLEPVQRVDAVIDGSACGLSLADELAALEPCGMGNPGPRLMIPGARFDNVRTMGEGRHARFTVRSGSAGAQAVAFGCDGDPGAAPEEAVDACFRLERNTWRGTVEPRLLLRAVHRPVHRAIEVLGERDDYLADVIEELSRAETSPAERDTEDGPQIHDRREILDRRGESTLAVLRDATSTGGSVLAVCADVPRRLPGLQQRSGGYSLISQHALERDPTVVADFEHVIVLDPLTSEHSRSLVLSGRGYAHLAWGDAELGFSQRMHEMEYALREPLISLYRGLAEAGQAAGEALERLLRGTGSPQRPARLAARLVRILEELGLARFDRSVPSLALLGSAPTELERSPSFRAYRSRYEEGLTCLARAAQTRS